MQRQRRESSEAALKYAVFGAGTAGVMLYGMSLLAGVLGSAHLPTMAARLADLLQSRAAGHDRGRGADPRRADADGRPGLQALGRAVPLLGPGRVRGRPAEVAAFLSIASKAAALGLLVRLALSFARPPIRRSRPPWRPRGCTSSALIGAAGRRHVHLRQPGRLRADEHEAAAGLFDHRPCRLHDDARGRGRGPGRARRRRPRRRPWPRWWSTSASTCS